MNRLKPDLDGLVARLIEEFNFHPLTALIFVKYDGKCFYCGKNLLDSGLKYSKFMDCLLLKAKNPELEWDENNLAPSCLSCGITTGINFMDVLQKCNELLIDRIIYDLSTP